jgi:hypothetical protein
LVFCFINYYKLAPNDPNKQEQLNKIWSVIVGATLGGALAGIVF